MRACEHHALQVISEENINNEYMALQGETSLTSMVEITNTNISMIKAMREAYQMVTEFSIPEDEEIDE